MASRDPAAVKYKIWQPLERVLLLLPAPSLMVWLPEQKGKVCFPPRMICLSQPTQAASPLYTKNPLGLSARHSSFSESSAKTLSCKPSGNHISSASKQNLRNGFRAESGARGGRRQPRCHERCRGPCWALCLAEKITLWSLPTVRCLPSGAVLRMLWWSG